LLNKYKLKLLNYSEQHEQHVFFLCLLFQVYIGTFFILKKEVMCLRISFQRLLTDQWKCTKLCNSHLTKVNLNAINVEVLINIGITCTVT
jgi:hypothetical protein